MEAESADTVYRIETPEGVDLEVQLAGPVPRLLAYAIDASIRWFILIVLFILLTFADRMGMGIFLLLSFLFEWFYPVYFEVFKKGQTPGKRRFKLVVVNDDLTPVTWDTSMTRNLLRIADFLPFMYLLGLISMTVSQRFQRLGDIAAGTLVIHQQESQDVTPLHDAQPVMAPVALTQEDQVALISFLQRYQQLSQQRQQELADILADVTQQKSDKAVSYLHGIAAWLLGSK